MYYCNYETSARNLLNCQHSFSISTYFCKTILTRQALSWSCQNVLVGSQVSSLNLHNFRAIAALSRICKQNFIWAKFTNAMMQAYLRLHNVFLNNCYPSSFNGFGLSPATRAACTHSPRVHVHAKTLTGGKRDGTQGCAAGVYIYLKQSWILIVTRWGRVFYKPLTLSLPPSHIQIHVQFFHLYFLTPPAKPAWNY